LGEALAVGRGPPLGEFGEPFKAEAGRLEDLRLAALEERIEADLALGLHARLVGELEVLIARHAHRERLRGQLMLALYRSRRQTEALEVFRCLRATLVAELGVEPACELPAPNRAILDHSPTLAPPPRAAPAGARPELDPLVAGGDGRGSASGATDHLGTLPARRTTRRLARRSLVAGLSFAALTALTIVLLVGF